MNSTGLPPRKKRRQTSLITTLPEDVLDNIFGHLLPSSGNSDLPQLKHALYFSFLTPHLFTQFNQQLHSITFANQSSVEYGLLSSPNFIASLANRAGKHLKTLILPLVNPGLTFSAALYSCPNLSCLSFWDVGPRNPLVLDKLLLGTCMRSLEIYHVSNSTMMHLSNCAKKKSLENLNNLALRGILDWQVKDVISILSKLHQRLESVILECDMSGAIRNPCKRLVIYFARTYARKFNALRKLELLQIPEFDLRHDAFPGTTLGLRNFVWGWKNKLCNRPTAVIGNSLDVLKIGVLQEDICATWNLLGALPHGAEVYICFPGVRLRFPKDGTFQFELLQMTKRSMFTFIGFQDQLAIQTIDLGTHDVMLQFCEDKKKGQQEIRRLCNEGTQRVRMRITQHEEDAEKYLEYICGALDAMQHSVHTLEISVNLLLRLNKEGVWRLTLQIRKKQIKRIILTREELQQNSSDAKLRYLLGPDERLLDLTGQNIRKVAEFLGYIAHCNESLEEILLEGGRKIYIPWTRIEVEKKMYYNRKYSKHMAKHEVKTGVDLSSIIGWLEMI